ncbi:MAG: hypothetical protein EZS26_001992 [Candidatus Ordinivivax streblomastigis]|uniref:Uncharacterized protein n=1 Tax=Candidatus Ordinivivax streblomastigis TaxID=2540710 RepID=A0A5M8P082_9BACT|nr:MAG: hypothetical protein EZS26_001992 [Candidatus Ordinivivax streblomastigis]
MWLRLRSVRTRFYLVRPILAGSTCGKHNASHYVCIGKSPIGFLSQLITSIMKEKGGSNSSSSLIILYNVNLLKIYAVMQSKGFSFEGQNIHIGMDKS